MEGRGDREGFARGLGGDWILVVFSVCDYIIRFSVMRSGISR